MADFLRASIPVLKHATFESQSYPIGWTRNQDRFYPCPPSYRQNRQGSPPKRISSCNYHNRGPRFEQAALANSYRLRLSARTISSPLPLGEGLGVKAEPTVIASSALAPDPSPRGRA